MTTDFDQAWSRLPAALQAHPGIKDLQRAHLAAFAAPVEKAAPSTPSDARALAQMLMAGADDPMWANHAEVNKATLRRAAEVLQFMAGRVERHAACVRQVRTAPALPEWREMLPSDATALERFIHEYEPAFMGEENQFRSYLQAVLVEAQQAAQPVAGEPVARMHPDGRVIPEATYANGARDGGATWSSVKGYTIPLYTAATAPVGHMPLTDEQIEAAAKKLAEVMDYPWEHMPDQGREKMRANARQVLAAAGGA